MAKKKVAQEVCPFCESQPCECATVDKRKVHKPTQEEIPEMGTYTEISVRLTDDGEVVAADHGPWCDDSRTFPPPPRCQGCHDDSGEA